MKSFSLGLIFSGLVALSFFRDAEPFVKLVMASVMMLFIVKIAALVWQSSRGVHLRPDMGLLIFIFLWPGVIYQGFERRPKDLSMETGQHFFESWLYFILGCMLLLVASFFGKGESAWCNYLALFSVLLILHMGILEVATDGLRLLGYQPRSLFYRPLLSVSLNDFWSNRWNRAFVDMNKLFILEPLRGRLPRTALILFIFLVSGLLHELAISYPAGGPWGLPLLYFAFQGLGVVIEKKWGLPRYLIFTWVLLPIPVLFPPQFVNLFLGGLCGFVYHFLFTGTLIEVLHWSLMLGAVLHLLVLCASVQVPRQLNWREEFQRLRTLNRKVVWTYGAYIFAIIVFMGGVSLHLAGLQHFVMSELIWLMFIALFWWARIGIDFFYMKDEDWPEGPLFKIGHVCLSTLFITLAFLYTALSAFIGAGLHHG